MVSFDYVQQFHYVQVSIELRDPFVQVKVLLGSLDLLQTWALAACKAAEVVKKCLACIVTQSALIQDQVEDVEELLALWLLAYQLWSLFAQLFHKSLVYFVLSSSYQQAWPLLNHGIWAFVLDALASQIIGYIGWQLVWFLWLIALTNLFWLNQIKFVYSVHSARASPSCLIFDTCSSLCRRITCGYRFMYL